MAAALRPLVHSLPDDHDSSLTFRPHTLIRPFMLWRRLAAATAALLPWLVAAQSAPAPSPTLARIRQRGTLLVGSAFKYRTFVYHNRQTGQYEGFCVDIAKALAKRELGDPSKLEWRYAAGTGWDNIQPVIKGEVDVIIDAVAANQDKKSVVDFSDEFFHSGSALLVPRGSPIRGVSDLGKGTRVLYFVLDEDWKTLKSLAPEATYVEYADPRDAFEALQAGKGDVYTDPMTHLFDAAAQAPGFVAVGRYPDRTFSIVSPRSDPAFLADLNDFLETLHATGEYERLFQKWFGPVGGNETRPPSPGWNGPVEKQEPVAASSAEEGRSEGLDRIRARGRIIVGSAFKFHQLNFKNPRTGEPEGFMVDIARRLAGALVGDPSKVEWRFTGDGNNVGHVIRGDVDFLIDAVGREPQKTSVTAYSDEIFHSGSGLLVPTGSPIRYVGDIDDNTRVIYCRTNLDVKYIRAEVPGAIYLGFDTPMECIAALKAGKGDLFTDTVTHLYSAASQNPGYQVRGRYTDRSYSIICRKGDPALLARVNRFIKDLKSGGEYERLYATWITPYAGVGAR
jgi:putative glutamine transport system substrate-binding protein